MDENEELVERDARDVRIALLEDRVKYLEKCVIQITDNLEGVVKAIQGMYGI